jgi:hypothetical protein
MLTCDQIRTFTNFFSFIGPRRKRKKFRIVRLVDSRIAPVVGCTTSSVRPNVESVRRVSVVNDDGVLWNKVFEG